MAYLKYFVNNEEKQAIEDEAREKGVSVSALTRRKFGLVTDGIFAQTLEEVVDLAKTKAKTLSDKEFFAVPDLYSPLDWRKLTKTVGAGQLGRRFNERVSAGEVEGVIYLGMKNRRAVYTKI